MPPSKDEIVQIKSEQLGSFEQLKFVFVEFKKWLLDMRAKSIEEMMDMIENLKKQFPRAHKILRAYIDQFLSISLGVPVSMLTG